MKKNRSDLKLSCNNNRKENILIQDDFFLDDVIDWYMRAWQEKTRQLSVDFSVERSFFLVPIFSESLVRFFLSRKRNEHACCLICLKRNNKVFLRYGSRQVITPAEGEVIVKVKKTVSLKIKSLLKPD